MTKLFDWGFSTYLCALFVLVQISITTKYQKVNFGFCSLENDVNISLSNHSFMALSSPFFVKN